MSRINDYFTDDEYLVVFGHDMLKQGYNYVEDCTEKVSRELFIALFKLFVTGIKNNTGISYNTFEDIAYYFDDEFGIGDRNPKHYDFIDNLEDKDLLLTKKEYSLIKICFTNLINDIIVFEKEKCGVDDKDFNFKKSIKNKSFLIVLSTDSLL